jgi:hypothetical protein
VQERAAGTRSGRRGDQAHLRVASVDQPQDPLTERQRLQRDHAAAQPAKARDAIADVRADVECKIARTQIAGVKSIHGGLARAVAVVHPQRTQHAGKRSRFHRRIASISRNLAG